MVMELTLQYVHAEHIGYGRTGVVLADELAKKGVTIYDDDGYCLTAGPSPMVTPPDGRIAPESPTNAVCWVSVPTHAARWYEGQHRSIVTMWESNTLPEAFRESIHEFDLVMVPSWHNVELFSRYHHNVQFLPLGIDPELWNYSPPPKVGPTFDFLIAGRGERKGTDLAYEAFQTVFGHWWDVDENGEEIYRGPEGAPIPRLIMKSLRGHGKFYAPGIVHMPGKLSPEDEVAVYRNAHCYIQPSRGEGFGLQPLQAIAVGRPTILTNAHGHEAYAHLGIGISAGFSTAAKFLMGDAGDWWEPDLEELCEAMWDVYSNYDTHAQRAKESAATVAKEWTWANTADRYLELLGAELTKPYSGSGEWQAATRKVFKIITSQDHYSEAAGVSRFFLKGREYYDIADVKRILFDAGVLDPACIDNDDDGITPAQWESMEDYKAQHSYCPTCNQRLNTLPTHSDDILAKVEQDRLQEDFESQVARIA